MLREATSGEEGQAESPKELRIDDSKSRGQRRPGPGCRPAFDNKGHSGSDQSERRVIDHRSRFDSRNRAKMFENPIDEPLVAQLWLPPARYPAATVWPVSTPRPMVSSRMVLPATTAVPVNSIAASAISQAIRIRPTLFRAVAPFEPATASR